MLERIIDDFQQRIQSQQVSNSKAIAPMPELSQLELLAVTGAGARRRLTEMF